MVAVDAGPLVGGGPKVALSQAICSVVNGVGSRGGDLASVTVATPSVGATDSDVVAMKSLVSRKLIA